MPLFPKKDPNPNQKRTLEICCYVAGAGAFGVFLRWLQDQMAFTEDGLAEKSAFHLVVIAYILVAAYVFLRFVDRERNSYGFLPENFDGALANPGKLYTVLRWAAGIVVCLGALLLYASSEIDEDVTLLRVLAVLGFLFGASYPALLGSANKAGSNRLIRCLAACLPVVFFALWLIISYKQNDINSVIWGYAIEMLAIVSSMFAFFRLAGFLFDTPRGWRSMFDCMLGAASCIMALADERYMGMQLMFLGTAGLLLLCNWILFMNLGHGKPPEVAVPDDGFERLWTEKPKGKKKK